MTTFSLLIPQRLIWILAGTAVVSATAFWRPSLDTFGYPKFAVVIFGVALAVAVAVYGGVVTGRVLVPWGLAGVAVVAFAVLVLAVFLLRPSTIALVGGYARHTGALFYVVLAVGALLMLRAAGGGDAHRWLATRNLALGVAATGGLVGAVGLLQLVGVDPLDRAGEPVVTATFGNPNFAAALVGVTASAAAWAAWDRAHGVGLRVVGGLTVLATLATAVGTRSVQGPVTAAVGLLVFALAVLLGVRDQRMRRAGMAAWSLLTVVGGALGAASLMGRGPLGGLADAANVELRSYYWSAGLRMFADNPLTGVGLERYGASFGQYRSEAAAQRLDLAYSVDAAHNVPIQLLATGGIFVGLAYLAFVVLTGVALVLAVRRTAGRPRLLVGALGGVWAAYQAQSLVSIETPPLALLHWLSAAAIISWSGMVRIRAVQLPWSSRRRDDVRFRQRISGAVLAIGLVALVVWLLRPLGAGMAAARGAALADAGRFDEAIIELEEATDRSPWEPTYRHQLGDVALRADEPDLAMEAYQEALEREPRSIIALVTAARIAAAAGDAGEAGELYERALQVEPLAPTLLEEAATFFERQGDASRAAELRERAATVAG